MSNSSKLCPTHFSSGGEKFSRAGEAPVDRDLRCKILLTEVYNIVAHIFSLIALDNDIHHSDHGTLYQFL